MDQQRLRSVLSPPGQWLLKKEKPFPGWGGGQGSEHSSAGLFLCTPLLSGLKINKSKPYLLLFENDIAYSVNVSIKC